MSKFLSELKRRNVTRVGIAYLTIAWLVIEVSNTILPLFDVGPGASRVIVILLAIGFLPVLLIAWTFEFTATGIKLDKDVDRSADDVRADTKRLDRFIIVLLGIALVYFAVDKFVFTQPGEPADSEAGARSIAVLPFANTSGDPGNDYLSNGLSDALRDALQEIPGVLVMGRRSSVRFEEQGLDATAIGDQLGVGRIIEGRFNRQGNKYFVTVELIDAKTGFRLWAQGYERASRDLMVLQQDLARAVTSQLAPTLAPAEEVRKPTAQQVSAHNLLMLGRQYEQEVTDQQVVDETKLNQAIDLYRQVIEADPQSAEAHARLGKMLLYLGDVDAAADSIYTALQLDPDQSDANATQGLYYWLTRQPGIGAAYQRAIQLNPNNADALAYYAEWLWMQRDALAAEDYFRRASKVDPRSLEPQAKLGYKLAFAGKREEAEKIVQRILDLFPSAPGYLAAARIAEAYGSPEQAIALELKALALQPDDADIEGQIAESLARIGDFESAAIFEPEPGIGLLFWSRRYVELIALGEELMIEYPDDDDMLFLLAFALNTQGRFEESMRIYGILGMPQTWMSEARRPNELHHILSFVGALQGVGQTEQAAELAELGLAHNANMRSGDSGAWAVPLGVACDLSILGDDEAALTVLEKLPTLPTIVWLPYLKDLTCLQTLVDEPRYQAVVAAIEERLAGIRSNLPKVLHGYGLVPLGPAQK